MNGVILMGSARLDGDCARVATTMAKALDFKVIELKTHDFSDYDYAGTNQNDDFIPLLRHIVESADQIIFATPVYWYSMSGIMKRFFDRLTDGLTHHKALGRQLRGKCMGLVSVNHDTRNPGFEIPFELSAEYLGMHYLGDVHINLSVLDSHPITQQLQPLTNPLSQNNRK